MTSAANLRIFSTCPPSANASRDAYLHRVQEIASWSEDAGCEGILVTTDNAQVDPWLVSQAIVMRHIGAAFGAAADSLAA